MYGCGIQLGKISHFIMKTFFSSSLGENEPMSRRISSIEGFRVLAILGVILWHTDLLLRLRQLGGGRWPVDVTINMVWWVSLPYFFIVAGYFYGKSVEAEGEPIRHLCRYASSLFGILVAWLCVYTVVPDNWLVAVRDHGWWQPFQSEALKNVTLLETQHIRLFLGVTAGGNAPVWHLWFLPALMFGLANVALIVVFRLQRYMIPFMVGLYGVALPRKSPEDISMASAFISDTCLSELCSRSLDRGWQDVGNQLYEPQSFSLWPVTRSRLLSGWC